MSRTVASYAEMPSSLKKVISSRRFEVSDEQISGKVVVDEPEFSRRRRVGLIRKINPRWRRRLAAVCLCAVGAAVAARGLEWGLERSSRSVGDEVRLDEIGSESEPTRSSSDDDESCTTDDNKKHKRRRCVLEEARSFVWGKWSADYEAIYMPVIDGAWYDLRRTFKEQEKPAPAPRRSWRAPSKEAKKTESAAVESLRVSAALLRQATPSKPIFGKRQIQSLDQFKEEGLFLRGVEALMPTFKAFGSAIHAAANKDVAGNVRKLENNLSGGKLTFAQSVVGEIARGESNGPDSSSQALIWLKRILRFTAAFFENLLAYRKRPLQKCLVQAYNDHLGPHHNLVMRKIAGWLMRIIPDRSAMLRCFEVEDFEDLAPKLRAWIDAALPLIAFIDQSYTNLDLPI